MSNHLAIATVTAAMRQILVGPVSDAAQGAPVITGRPPDHSDPETCVHLFLYQVSPNTALCNRDLPTRDSRGTVTARPTMALDLHYLLAFYGKANSLEPQRMLGAAVQALLAEPGLTRERITSVSKTEVAGSNLADAVEQVKFTPLPLSLDELSKLWSVFFQTPYVLSIAYRATVVVIESDEPIKPALPVLKRGEDGRGVSTSPDLSQADPFPALDSLHIGEEEDDAVRLSQPSYPSAKLGTILTLQGRNIAGDSLFARFTHAHLRETFEIPASPMAGSSGALKVVIPGMPVNPGDALEPDAQNFAAGIYAVALIVKNNGIERSTNALPLSFAPQIRSDIQPAVVDAGDAVVTVNSALNVRCEQRAVLLLPDREVAAEPRQQPTDPLLFKITRPNHGEIVVRLRVDEVENQPFKRVTTPSPHLVIDQWKVQFPP